MVYASETPSADYGNQSKYASPGASGSGENAQELKRLDELVTILSAHVLDERARILDIGCARGGLLQALRRAGFVNAEGIDPSRGCVEACRVKRLIAHQADFTDLNSMKNKWDCIILSHVLEHVEDVKGALESIHEALAPEGILYVETPNALRYSANVPFMETNREHINHFDLGHLMKVIDEMGFSVESCGRRDFVRFQTPIPSIYVIASRTGDCLSASVSRYLEDSEEELIKLERSLREDLEEVKEIVLWGFGEFAQTLLRTKILQQIKIIQIIDSDKGKHGDRVGGLIVESPEGLSDGLPILIGSIVNRENILRDIQKMKLKNRVIMIGES